MNNVNDARPTTASPGAEHPDGGRPSGRALPVVVGRAQGRPLAELVADHREALAQFEKNATAIIDLARELLTKEARP